MVIMLEIQCCSITGVINMCVKGVQDDVYSKLLSQSDTVSLNSVENP